MLPFHKDRNHLNQEEIAARRCADMGGFEPPLNMCRYLALGGVGVIAQIL